MSKCHHRRDCCRESRRHREPMACPMMPSTMPICGSCLMTPRGPICVVMPGGRRMR